MEFYLLDSELNKKHLIDIYSSAIWVPRYNDIGDCELVIDATSENLKKIKECKYIARDDDDMVCKIEKIEIKTDVEKWRSVNCYRCGYKENSEPKNSDETNQF